MNLGGGGWGVWGEFLLCWSLESFLLKTPTLKDFLIRRIKLYTLLFFSPPISEITTILKIYYTELLRILEDAEIIKSYAYSPYVCLCTWFHLNWEYTAYKQRHIAFPTFFLWECVMLSAICEISA